MTLPIWQPGEPIWQPGDKTTLDSHIIGPYGTVTSLAGGQTTISVWDYNQPDYAYGYLCSQGQPALLYGFYDAVLYGYLGSLSKMRTIIITGRITIFGSDQHNDILKNKFFFHTAPDYYIDQTIDNLLEHKP